MTSDNPLPRYTNECILIARVVRQEDGNFKIRSVEEFVDSKFTSEFFGPFRKRDSPSALTESLAKL